MMIYKLKSRGLVKGSFLVLFYFSDSDAICSFFERWRGKQVLYLALDACKLYSYYWGGGGGGRGRGRGGGESRFFIGLLISYIHIIWVEEEGGYATSFKK